VNGMPLSAVPLRDQARAIWQAAVDAARPEDLVYAALNDPALPCRDALANAPRILIVGAGKAGAAMSAGAEQALLGLLDHTQGIVNVPAEVVRPLQAIRLHAARPADSKQPTAAGVAGCQEIRRLPG